MSDPEDENEWIEALLSEAKLSIERGETELKRGIEKIAEAERLGVSRREIAKAVGKSTSWVSRMLKWHKMGPRDETPFGPQSKEARRRKAVVEATKRSEGLGGSTVDELLRANPIWTAAPAKKSERTGAAPSAHHVSSRAKASRQLEKEQDTAATAVRPGISGSRRQLLLEALDGLAASDPAERANAASWVETCRSTLNLSWDELIVTPDEPQHQVGQLKAESAGQLELAAHG